MVEKILASDYPGSLSRGWARAEEFSAVRALQPGEAIKFPCRWRHAIRSCGGAGNAYAVAQKKGFRVHATCRGKVVYVLRPEG